jgi:hypothetical protein
MGGQKFISVFSCFGRLIKLLVPITFAVGSSYQSPKGPVLWPVTETTLDGPQIGGNRLTLPLCLTGLIHHSYPHTVFPV